MKPTRRGIENDYLDGFTSSVQALVGLLCGCWITNTRQAGPADEVTPQIMKKLNSILEADRPMFQPTIRGPRSLGVYTMEQVAKHNTLDDGWLVYNNQVYDVSKWARYHHPGGRKTIERFLGRDATDEIRAFHTPQILQAKLPAFLIGTVGDPPPVSQVQKDFRQLHAYFEQEGYFGVTMSYYIIKSILCLGILAIAWSLLYFSRKDSVHLVAAMVLGIFWQQIAFIGHDAGHMAVFANRQRDEALGLVVGNLLNGISIGWWKSTHNVHHVVPNSVHDDPDIAHLPVFAVHPSILSSLYNTYHERVMRFEGLARVLIPYQHLLYYPVCAFAKFNLYLQSAILLCKSPTADLGYVKEWVFFLGFFVWVGTMLTFLNSHLMRIAFLFVAHAVSGLLFCQITLSHFSMPVNGGIQENYGGDFFTRNIKASLDISCSNSMDWLHGGLQFQTLHHCFPRLSRSYLRRCRPFIKALCTKHNIPYSELSFIEANVAVLHTLWETARRSNTWSPMLVDTAFAIG